MDPDHLERLTKAEQRAASNTHRIDALEKNTTLMHEMNINIALIAEQTKDTKDDIKTLKTDVEEIKSKPNKLVDKAKENVLGIILGALVGALIALIL